MKRFLVLAYGVSAYVLFLSVFVYLMGFVSGVFVPTTVDGGMGNFGVLGNVGLILLFGLQHTIMARSRFKTRFTHIVSPAIERSTFVFASSLLLVLLFRFWSPIEGVLWDIESTPIRITLYAIASLGWGVALISTFLINHFDLFGLRQTFLYFLGKEYTQLKFKKVGFYKCVRHPLMLGFLIAFWSTPTMTLGHFCFSMAMSVYILVGILFEEHELKLLHGADYSEYQAETGMLFPLPGRR